MTNDTIHDSDTNRKDMSIAAIKERRKERQSLIEHLRGKAKQEQTGREAGKQQSEEEHRDD